MRAIDKRRRPGPHLQPPAFTAATFVRFQGLVITLPFFRMRAYHPAGLFPVNFASMPDAFIIPALRVPSSNTIAGTPFTL
jgi:hypothetical protein